MKHRKSTRVLSFYLAILAAVMLLSFGTLSVYASEDEIATADILADETVIDSQSTADQSEYEESAEVAAGEAELETEVVYYEYEIENTAMTTPPMTAPPMTDIGGSVDPDGLELETGFLQSGVYAIENVGNDNYYMSVESGSVDSGFRVVQQNYGSNTPLTNFSRASLFKVTRIGETNRYIIRAMTNNRLSICPDTDINEDEMITSFINTDDANALGRTYTIVMAGSLCTIKPYGSSEVIAAPNSTASGDTNAEAAQLTLMTQTAAGTRGKWRFTKYTGNEKYGYHIYRTAGMGDGLVKGNTGTIWLKTWSTVINANTPYLAIKSPYSSVATADWQANNYLATITAHKCGDYEMEIQTRLGSSSTVRHTQYTTYTVIPDIVGDTTFVQNVETDRYMEVDSGSTSDGGIVQQNMASTHPRTQWIFELGGGGYFKIKNANSGKYLGVDSSNNIKVKQYTTETDYTLWKLTETSNGRYKISCKASALSGKALSAPSSTSGDGEDLTMIDYQYNTSYKNVWIVKEYIGSINITLRVDEGYMTRYPNYALKLSQITQAVKEKLWSDYYIKVTYSSVSPIITLADECSHSIGGNHDSICPHGDNDSLNNDSDGLCSNSSFSSTGDANKTLHHKNLYNTVYRIPFPDISENTLVVFSGHNYCKMDGNDHVDAGIYGMSWTNYGFAFIKNFSSTLSERKTFLHEILHWYGAPDHYNIGDAPSSEEMGEDFNPRCIFGEDKDSDDVMANLTICEGCQKAICDNLDKFNH